MRTWTTLTLLVMLHGCGRPWDIVDANSPVEEMLLHETDRFASTLHVRVNGEITDTFYGGDSWVATGWYSRGVAYYYRPEVERNVSIEPKAGRETATNIAAHEVAHAISPFHDCKHWTLCASIATPTYPSPCKE